MLGSGGLTRLRPEAQIEASTILAKCPEWSMRRLTEPFVPKDVKFRPSRQAAPDHEGDDMEEFKVPLEGMHSLVD